MSGDRRSLELPAVLIISAQLLPGVLFDFGGPLVASPLTSARGCEDLAPLFPNGRE